MQQKRSIYLRITHILNGLFKHLIKPKHADACYTSYLLTKLINTARKSAETSMYVTTPAISSQLNILGQNVFSTSNRSSLGQNYFNIFVPQAVKLHTCYVTIVLLQLMGLHPLVATLFVDMNFMVVRTNGNL